MLVPYDPPEDKKSKTKKYGDARWYNVTGQVCDWMRDDANPNDKGRRVDFEMARQAWLLPSVTTLTSGGTDPFHVRGPAWSPLDAWREGESARVGYALEHKPGEGLDAYMARFRAELKARGNSRINIGRDAHAAIEALHRGQPVTAPDHVKAAVEGYGQWFSSNVVQPVMAEQPVVSKEGFAGTLDSVLQLRSGGIVLADVKAVEASDNWRDKAYKHRGEQLAAYMVALTERGIVVDDACNILVNSSTGEVHVHSWRAVAGEQNKWMRELVQSFRERVRLFGNSYQIDLREHYARGAEIWRERAKHADAAEAERIYAWVGKQEVSKPIEVSAAAAVPPPRAGLEQPVQASSPGAEATGRAHEAAQPARADGVSANGKVQGGIYTLVRHIKKPIQTSHGQAARHSICLRDAHGRQFWASTLSSELMRGIPQAGQQVQVDWKTVEKDGQKYVQLAGEGIRPTERRPSQSAEPGLGMGGPGIPTLHYEPKPAIDIERRQKRGGMQL